MKADERGRRRQRPKGRDALLDAAEELMGSRGFHAVSVAELCAASGFPAGSLYYHFGSKSGLLLAALDRGISRIDERLAPVRAGAVPIDRAFDFFDAVARSAAKHPNLHRMLLYGLLEQNSDVDNVVSSFRSQLIDRGTDEFRASLNALDPDIADGIARDAAESMSAWLAGQFVLDPAGLAQRTRDQVDDLIYVSLHRRGASRSIRSRTELAHGRPSLPPSAPCE